VPESLPTVHRIDLDDNQLAFLALMLQSLQAKLQMDIAATITTGQQIVVVHAAHPEVLLGIGKKVDAFLSQEQYDITMGHLLGIHKCPDCGEFHA
jgi:hypothetical protein